MSSFRLTTIRERRILTPLGWGTVFLVIGTLVLSIILNIYSFLAPTQPVQGDILVVEGWLPEYALDWVRKKFQNENRQLLVVTGGKLTVGYHLSKYKTWAHLGAETLREQGIRAEKILSIPSPDVQKDRTYATAVEVKKRLAEKSLTPQSIDVISFGPHSRRTWLMFKTVFQPQVQVGIIAIEPREYDSSRWWVSSAGVRTMISEVIAYLYARLIFSPR
ncbi:hypothetical protein UR09_01760 [Candidatus Nitromaritima sp. SCGC AAA799-A02]|nr:hypothetical protein UR09_01760 [Candidatus Nitromaritima sp. SCGC AAA799-A02]